MEKLRLSGQAVQTFAASEICQSVQKFGDASDSMTWSQRMRLLLQNCGFLHPRVNLRNRNPGKRLQSQDWKIPPWVPISKALWFHSFVVNFLVELALDQIIEICMSQNYSMELSCRSWASLPDIWVPENLPSNISWLTPSCLLTDKSPWHYWAHLCSVPHQTPSALFSQKEYVKWQGHPTEV